MNRKDSDNAVCLQKPCSFRSSGFGSTNEFAWKNGGADKGAQIDLIISRKDGVINLCEMKFTSDDYMLDADEYEKLRNRMLRFQKETNVKSAIHITLICGNGYKKGKYSGIVQNVILGDDLFEK